MQLGTLRQLSDALLSDIRRGLEQMQGNSKMVFTWLPVRPREQNSGAESGRAEEQVAEEWSSGCRVANRHPVDSLSQDPSWPG